MKTIRDLAWVCLIATSAVATAAPPSASQVLKSAEALAAKEHKNVLVVFHASWCGWCHRLDGFFADPKAGPLITSSYVIAKLDVLENADKKSLENVGGAAMMARLKGEGAGLPFMAVLSPKGELLATSCKTLGDAKTNIGYPAAPDEIAHFGNMLQKTAPKLSTGQRDSLVSWLKAHTPGNP